MPPLVLKLFAGQCTGRTDGQIGDYMLPPVGSIITSLYIEGSKINHTVTCNNM